YGQPGTTTPAPPKTRSMTSIGDTIVAPEFEVEISGQPKIRSLNELMTLQVFVENLSRTDGCKKDNVTVPDEISEFLKMQDPPEYRFPWGFQDLTVDRIFWLQLACLDLAKKGWLGDSVYFPVNEPERHWCLAELQISTGVVTFYDTLGWVKGNRRPWWRNMKRNLPQQLTSYLNEHGVLASKGISVEQYEIKYAFPNVVRQADDSGDCGVWVCIFLYRLSRKQPLAFKDPIQTVLAYRETMLQYFWNHKFAAPKSVLMDEACLDLAKKGWLGDSHLDLWVDLMWSFREPDADWAMVSPFFLPCILGGSMHDYFSNGVMYPVPWRNVEKVYFPVNEPERHWCLAELQISTGVVTFYDTLGWVKGNRRPWWRNMKRNLPQQLTSYLNEHGVLASKGISVEQYEIKYAFPNVVRQADDSGDCGVWVCIFLYRLSRKQPLAFKDPIQTVLAYRETMLQYFWNHKFAAPKSVLMDEVYHEILLGFGVPPDTLDPTIAEISYPDSGQGNWSVSNSDVFNKKTLLVSFDMNTHQFEVIDIPDIIIRPLGFPLTISNI
ncbi:phospholipase-like protein, partial [Tanacetum coccineum]